MYYYTMQPADWHISIWYGDNTCTMSFMINLTASSTVPNSSYYKYFSDSSFSISFSIPNYINSIAVTYSNNATATKNGSTINIRNISSLPTTNGSTISLYVNIQFNIDATSTTVGSNTCPVSGSINGFNVVFNRSYNTNPQFSISPSTLSFGNITKGSKVTKEVTVTLENAYTTSTTFSGDINLSGFEHSVSMSSYYVYKGTKSNVFTYKNVTYATYTCTLSITFTGNYFDENKLTGKLYGWHIFGNVYDSNLYSNYANLTITANVIDENSSSGDVANTSGQIYLGNNLLSGFGDNLPIGTILMFYGSKSSIPSNWHVCDGTNGTPNLQDRVIVCASQTKPVGLYGGSRNFYDDYTLTINQMPEHDHTYIIPKIYVGWSDNADDRKVVRWDNDSGNWENRTSSKKGSNSPINPPKYYMLLYIMKISA